MNRRTFIGSTAFLGASLAVALDQTALAQTANANEQAPDRAKLNTLGPEGEALAKRVGIWDLTETIWKSPNAEPETTTGLVAERFMMGALLQEIIRPAGDTLRKSVKRTDWMTFNRVEARWQYVSFDTRDPIGLMPAWSNSVGDGKSVALDFYPMALWSDDEAGGILLRMRQVTRFDGPDTDSKDQYFTLADGKGVEWLGHRYSYNRQS
jgi:hypothetical protein